MFDEIMYRYLDLNYSKDFFINPKYCVVVDLSSGQEICYDEVLNGNLPSLIDSTLNDLKNLLG